MAFTRNSRTARTVGYIGFVVGIVLFLYAILTYLYHGAVPPPQSYARYFILAIMVASVYSICKDVEIIYIIERTIFCLVIISMVFYVIQLLQPDLLFNAMRFIENSIGIGSQDVYNTPRYQYSSIFIYTINVKRQSEFIRNCGFSFEPIAHSFFINLGILFNYIINRKIIPRQFSLYIIALLTTMSTTGLIGLMLILVYILADNKRLRLIIFPLALITLIVFMNVDYGFNKVEDAFFERRSIQESLDMATRHAGVSLGRITALEFATWYTFHNSPFIGFYGTQDPLFDNIGSPSGLARIIMHFGFVGVTLILTALYFSIKMLVTTIYKKEHYAIIYIFMLLYLAAHSFVASPIIWFFTLFFLNKQYAKRFVSNTYNSKTMGHGDAALAGQRSSRSICDQRGMAT
ncbi:MAG: hypothetical protein PHO01_10375 [Desulfotomaculaceae bacterium]|nr:hypothetical protein [Desulfotomaculaceae bacterium]